MNQKVSKIYNLQKSKESEITKNFGWVGGYQVEREFDTNSQINYKLAFSP